MMLPEKRHSMLVVSEFVGCSPSLSGAIRVNPWSIEAVRCGSDGRAAQGSAAQQAGSSRVRAPARAATLPCWPTLPACL